MPKYPHFKPKFERAKEIALNERTKKLTEDGIPPKA